MHIHKFFAFEQPSMFSFDTGHPSTPLWLWKFEKQFKTYKTMAYTS